MRAGTCRGAQRDLGVGRIWRFLGFASASASILNTDGIFWRRFEVKVVERCDLKQTRGGLLSGYMSPIVSGHQVLSDWRR